MTQLLLLMHNRYFVGCITEWCIKWGCITQWPIMIVIPSENELPEYVGYANCIEYKIKSYHKYMTIPVLIKTRGMKLPSSTCITITIKLCLRCVIVWQSYPSLYTLLYTFSVYSMIHHYGFYPKPMIHHYVIHPTNCSCITMFWFFWMA